MKEYTKILGRYAAELKYEALPAGAIEQAKKIMLHTVAVSVASRNMSPTANAAAMAAARGTAGLHLDGPRLGRCRAGGIRLRRAEACVRQRGYHRHCGCL